MKKKIFMGGFFVGLLMVLAVSAYAIPYGFYNITNNSGIASTIAGQFIVDVISDPFGAKFTFSNVGPTASFIAQIYFDDGPPQSLLQLVNVVNGPGGVSFAQGGTPANLPSQNTATPAFVTTPGFLATANNPAPQKGVNVGEFVSIIFSLNGKTFSDVINDMNTGNLRAGIHVQGIGTSDASDSFVSQGPSQVPVPESGMLILLGAGLLGLMAVRKRN